MKHHKYSTEEVNWIINNYDNNKYTYEEFAKVFNKEFNAEVTKEGIKNRYRKRKLGFICFTFQIRLYK